MNTDPKNLQHFTILVFYDIKMWNLDELPTIIEYWCDIYNSPPALGFHTTKIYNLYWQPIRKNIDEIVIQYEIYNRFGKKKVFISIDSIFETFY